MSGPKRMVLDEAEMLRQFRLGTPQAKIAKALDVSQMTVCRRLIELGLKRPRSTDPKAVYLRQHRAVVRARGRPDHCVECGCLEPRYRFEWANLTGKYTDVNDFAPMCVTCHRRYDGARTRERNRQRHMVKTGE